MRGKAVTSNQSGTHPRLEAVVRRHLNTPYRRPVAEHTRRVFERIAAWRDPNRPLILDSGCGTGTGAARLAARHPETLVLGLDKSAARLECHPVLPVNARLERAELGDFWRLYVEEFARALRLAGIDAVVEPVPDEPPLTAFEAKYRASGQGLWRCRANFNTTTTTRPALPADRAG